MKLGQNYPNPFYRKTTFEYTLPRGSNVLIEVYNPLGQLIDTMDQGYQPAGLHRVQWYGTDASGNAVGAGVYYYQLVTEGFKATRQMILFRM